MQIEGQRNSSARTAAAARGEEGRRRCWCFHKQPDTDTSHGMAGSYCPSFNIVIQKNQSLMTISKSTYCSKNVALASLTTMMCKSPQSHVYVNTICERFKVQLDSFKYNLLLLLIQFKLFKPKLFRQFVQNFKKGEKNVKLKKV